MPRSGSVLALPGDTGDRGSQAGTLTGIGNTHRQQRRTAEAPAYHHDALAADCGLDRESPHDAGATSRAEGELACRPATTTAAPWRWRAAWQPPAGPTGRAEC